MNAPDWKGMEHLILDEPHWLADLVIIDRHWSLNRSGMERMPPKTGTTMVIE
jgi:hypothetical protein